MEEGLGVVVDEGLIVLTTLYCVVSVVSVVFPYEDNAVTMFDVVGIILLENDGVMSSELDVSLKICDDVKSTAELEVCNGVE